MTTNPDIKKQPAPWKPGQAHPERAAREWGGFNERAKQAQQKNIERDLFGRRQKEREASYNETSKPR